MKAQIYADDLILLEQLSKVGQFQVEKVESQDELNAEIQIVSDRKVSVNELKLLRINKEQHIFYLQSNSNDQQYMLQVKTVCNSLGIHVINPRLTIQQIIHDISKAILPSNEVTQTNIITFFSVLSNIGTTATCLSVARDLARYTDKKICVLGVNAWDDGTTQIEYEGKRLNEIKPLLSNKAYPIKLKGSFEDDEFIRNFHKYKRFKNKGELYYLAGNDNTKLEREYLTDEISYLFALAKERFDIVLVDAGCHFDNATIYQALRESDMKIMITNQQRKAIVKFEKIFNTVFYPLGYEKTHFFLVINKFVESTGSLPTSKDIYQELDITHLSTIPQIEYMGIQSELTNYILYDFMIPEYNENIEIISKAIAFRTAVKYETFEEDEEKKKSWFSLIRR